MAQGRGVRCVSVWKEPTVGEEEEEEEVSEVKPEYE